MLLHRVLPFVAATLLVVSAPLAASAQHARPLARGISPSATAVARGRTLARGVSPTAPLAARGVNAGFGGVGTPIVNFPFAVGGFSGFGTFSRDTVPAPPYFALHPPVYYGDRIFRNYGDSPFADLPYQRLRITQAPFIQPQVIHNVHMAEGREAASDDQVAGMDFIVNPFYTLDDGEEQLVQAEE